jgi:ElaB/YqjD/DUF883 family membrane-anchored ribosome-binding protein
MAARAKKTTVADDDLQGQLDALLSDLQNLQGDVRKLAAGAKSEASDRIAEALQAAEARVTAAIATAQGAAGEAYEQAEEWATDNIDSLRESVREEPIKALAIAAGIGAVFGLLFLRR